MGLSDNLRGPVFLEILNQYQLTQTQGSFVWATASFFGFFGSYLYPAVTRWLKLQGVAPFSLSTIALALLIVGRPGYGFEMVLLGSAIFGFALGIITVHINILIQRGVVASEQPPYLSGLHSMYALSSLAAPLVIVLVTWWGGSWRASFDLVAGLCLLAVIIMILGTQKLKAAILAEKIRHDQEAEESEVVAPRFLFTFLFAIILGGYVVAEIMISSRIATYLRSEKAMDLTSSSYAAAMFFVGLFVARAFLFFRPLRFSSFRQLLLSNCLSIFLIFAGILLHPYFLCATGLSMGLFYPISIVYLTEKFSRSMSAILSKSQALQALLIMSMHLMMGVLADQIGMRLSFLYGLIFLLLSTISLLMFEKIYSRTFIKGTHART